MSSTASLDHPVARFQALFATLSPKEPMPLDQVYAPSIVFEDPLHRFEGIDSLRAYFERLNSQLVEGRFTFDTPVIGEGMAVLPWVMNLRLRRLPHPVIVPGCSHIRYDQTGRITYQRDYFDAGALIYEQIPVLGFVIRRIKAAFQQ
jgi:hypothetical protein